MNAELAEAIEELKTLREVNEELETQNKLLLQRVNKLQKKLDSQEKK